MPGDIGRIPIISLSGCKYLTNILSELPLPSTPNVPIRCNTLLYDANIAQEACKRINYQDEKLVNEIIEVLESVKSNVHFIESSDNCSVDTSSVPVLLKSILRKRPELLGVKQGVESEQTKRVILCGDNPTDSSSGIGKHKKVKSGVIYNAVSVAPLRISIKKSDRIISSKKTSRKPKVKSSKNDSIGLPIQTSVSSETGVESTHLPVIQSISETNNSNSFPVSAQSLDKNQSQSCSLSVSTSISISITKSGDTVNNASSPCQERVSTEAVATAQQNLCLPTLNQPTNACSVDSLTSCINNPTSDHDTNPKLESLATSTGCDITPQTRRIPDPTLSQIFHSVALFHAYQSDSEPDKGQSSQGGGLFDDWTASTKDPKSSPTTLVTDSTSSAHTSSYQAITLAQSAVNHVTSHHNSDLALCLSHSPKTVFSNHSSHPITSVGNISVSPFNPNSVINSSVTAVPATSLTSKNINSLSNHAPLFDLADECSTLTAAPGPDILEEQTHATPHGLAAYLPRSGNQRIPNVSLPGPHDDGTIPSASSASPKSILSPSVDCIDTSSISPAETNSRFHYCKNSMKQIWPVTADVPSPSTSRHSLRGRFQSGKPRGGRRRRTELEELKRWSVTDHANPGNDQKNQGSFADDYLINLTDLKGENVDIQNAVKYEKESMDTKSADDCTCYGGFTEALVERVKRRRQQRAMETNGCKSLSKPGLQSSVETSPLSTPSPTHNHKPLVHSEKQVKLHNNRNGRKHIQEESHRSDNELSSSKEYNKTNADYCDNPSINHKLKYQASADSDISLSPDSTIISSVRSQSSCLDSSSTNSTQASPCDFQNRNNKSINENSSREMSTCNPIPSVQPFKFKNQNNVHKCDGNLGQIIPPDLSDAVGVPITSSADNSKATIDTKSENVTTKSKSFMPIEEKIDFVTENASHGSSVCDISPLQQVKQNSTKITFEDPAKNSAHEGRKIEHEDRFAQEMVYTRKQKFRNSTADGDSLNLSLNTKDGPNSAYAGYGNGMQSNSSNRSSEDNHIKTLTEFEPSNIITSDSDLVQSTKMFLHENKMDYEASESTGSSIASSSPRVPSRLDEIFDISNQRCRTPSTIAYTHSSAMEDNDTESLQSRIRECDKLIDLDSNSLSSRPRSRSVSSSSLQSNTKDIYFDSPSSLSAFSDEIASCDESELEDPNQSEMIVTTSATISHFTSKLGKILRRVEELDLLHLASDVQSKLNAAEQERNSNRMDSDAGSEIEQSDESLIPHPAKLTRQEIVSLCSESVKIRASGSMFTIPTGRLVRFLTLLLVNMQEAAYLVPKSTTVDYIYHCFKKRDKHSSNRSNCGCTEALFWSDLNWSSILLGLDCARTALNIIVGPDMPRPLLMEDLIEGIVSVTRRQLSFVINCFNSNVSRSGNPLHVLALSSVGSRLTQIAILLANLVKLQPNRFTDNLVINLTSLCLSIPSFCLTTGTNITSEWKRLLVASQKSIPVLTSFLHDPQNDSSDVTNLIVGGLFFIVWPEQLQRASLSLLAGLYGQYEAHRKMIVDEIFRTFLSNTEIKRFNGTANSVDHEQNNKCISSNKRTTRTFRIISSSYFYVQNCRLKSKPIHAPTEREPNSYFFHVHSLTALFLSLTQGLIQVPNVTTFSSVGVGALNRKFSAISTTPTPTQSSLNLEQATIDQNQLSRDEKQVLNSYNTAVRHAHYLLSGLFKRVSMKNEFDLRPVLETITDDLLTVAFHSPIEWPAASMLLNVLGSFLIQQFSQPNHNSNTNCRPRNSDLACKLMALDLLGCLTVGLKQSHKLYKINYNSPQAKVKSSQFEEFTYETNYQTRIVGFLSSPITCIHHWCLSFKDFLSVDNRNMNGYLNVNIDAFPYEKSHLYVPELCSKYSDCLILMARRFHMASWLHDCCREMAVNVGVDAPSEQIDTVSTKTRKHIFSDKLRCRLLAELAFSHVSAATVHQKQSTPVAGRGRSGNSCNPNSGLGGSILGQCTAMGRFIKYAHQLIMPEKVQIRLAAHTHLSAVHILYLHSILPNVDVLYGFICKLAGDASVPIRSKALHCLAAIVDVDPTIMTPPPDSSNSGHKSDTNPQSKTVFNLSNIVRARLLDNSTIVREAAVDLLSRCLTTCPHLLSQYHSLIAERVLDKALSVRKRAIKCFHDLLIADWNNLIERSQSEAYNPNEHFSIISNQICGDICLKLIRRLHDEESIRKLVIEVFHNLWLIPIPKSHAKFSKLLDRRIMSLATVTVTLRPNNSDLLDSFLTDVFNPNSSQNTADFDTACKQLISRLIHLIKRRPNAPFHCDSKTSIDQSHTRDSSHIRHSENVPVLMACLQLLSHSRPNFVRPNFAFLMDLLHEYTEFPLSTTTGSNQTNTQSQILYHLINVLEIILIDLSNNLAETDNPLMEAAALASVTRDNFIRAQVDLIHLVQRHGRLVVDSALSCLAVLVNNLVKERTEVMCCFAQFYGLLTDLSLELREALSTRVSCASTRIASRIRPSILRALYTVGLICKYFSLDCTMDLKKMPVYNSNLLEDVVDTLMLFAEYASMPTVRQDISNAIQPKSDMNDPDLCRKAITGLGFLLFRHDHLFTTGVVQTFFTRFFSANQHGSLTTTINTMQSNYLHANIAGAGGNKLSSFYEVQCIIIDNMTHYMLYKEREANTENRSWNSRCKLESLKELSDQSTSFSSVIAQTYLPIISKYCIITPSHNVRASALGFISTIFRQGLLHPSQLLVPLICLQTDLEVGIRTRAAHYLLEIEQKFPGFTAMRSITGIQFSYQLHSLFNHMSHHSGYPTSSPTFVRGAKETDSKITCSQFPNPSTTAILTTNHNLYSLLRSNRQHRRSLIVNLLSLFENNERDTITPSNGYTDTCNLEQLIFITDHLAHFPYNTLDEVYYVADCVEQRISVIGSNVLQSVYRTLLAALTHFHMIGKSAQLTNADACSSLQKFNVHTETDVMNLLDECEAAVPEYYALDCDPGKCNREQEELCVEVHDHKFDLLEQLFSCAQVNNLRLKARKNMIKYGPANLLLMAIRRHMRDFYALTYSKLKDYSSSHPPKVWEKPIVLPKQQHSLSDQLIHIPLIVRQYTIYSDWTDTNVGPSDNLILQQFFVLRRELLLNDDLEQHPKSNDRSDITVTTVTPTIATNTTYNSFQAKNSDDALSGNREISRPQRESVHSVDSCTGQAKPNMQTANANHMVDKSNAHKQNLSVASKSRKVANCKRKSVRSISSSSSSLESSLSSLSDSVDNNNRDNHHNKNENVEQHKLATQQQRKSYCESYESASSYSHEHFKQTLCPDLSSTYIKKHHHKRTSPDSSNKSDPKVKDVKSKHKKRSTAAGDHQTFAVANTLEVTSVHKKHSQHKLNNSLHTWKKVTTESITPNFVTSCKVSNKSDREKAVTKHAHFVNKQIDKYIETKQPSRTLAPLPKALMHDSSISRPGRSSSTHKSKSHSNLKQMMKTSPKTEKQFYGKLKSTSVNQRSNHHSRSRQTTPTNESNNKHYLNWQSGKTPKNISQKTAYQKQMRSVTFSSSSVSDDEQLSSSSSSLSVSSVSTPSSNSSLSSPSPPSRVKLKKKFKIS